MMRNRAEFHILDLAALFCGATPISIYNSSSLEQITVPRQRTAEACLAIVEDAGFLATFAKVRADMPDLRAIVVVDPEGVDADDGSTLRRAARRRARRPRRRRGHRLTRRPRHRHLHLGHDRAAQGRDAHPTSTSCWTIDSLRRSLELEPATVEGSCRTCRWRTSPNAWRATTCASRSGSRSRRCPMPASSRSYPGEVRPGDVLRRPTGLGEDPSGRRRGAGGRPGAGRSSSPRREAAIPITAASGPGTASRGQPPPGTSSTLSPSRRPRAARARRARRRRDRRGADVPRAAEWFRAVGVPLVGDLRHVASRAAR